MSTPANFHGARPVIDVNDSAMLLIESYAKAQDVVKKGEQLDSQR